MNETAPHIDGTAAARPIGRTGLRTAALAFGTVPLGNYPEQIDDARALRAVDHAWQRGIRLFDTAPLYGRGLAERRLGLALARRPREQIVLATKIGRRLIPSRGGVLNADAGAAIFAQAPAFDTVFDYTHDGAMRSIEDSLQRLGLARVDIVHIHNIDPSLHDAPTLEKMFSTCMNGAYRAIARLRDEGVIRAIGVGNNSLAMLERFVREGDFDCLMMAGHYTLLEQDAAAALLPDCLRRRVSILLGSPFESGVLASGVRADARFRYRPVEAGVADRVRRMETVCVRHGVPLASAALAFPLAHPAIAAVVPGLSSAEEVDASVDALRRGFPSGFWPELREAAQWDATLPLPA